MALPARNALLLFASTLPLAAIVLCAASAAPPAKKKTAAKKSAVAAAPAAGSFGRDVLPLVNKYCVSCHGAEGASAGFVLAGYKADHAVLQARDVWEKVSANVGARNMPPPGMPQPTQAERDQLTAFIDGTITQADCKIDDPGRPTLRRLNRDEYNNTVRDLLGVSLRPADEFPSDDVGYGFDNIGDVLSISPLLMEKYLAAAGKLARAAIIAPEDRSKPLRLQGSALAETGGRSFGETDGRVLRESNEALSFRHTFPAAGDYTLRVEAFGQQAGPEPARMVVRVDDRDVQTVRVEAVSDAPKVYTIPIKGFAGEHKVSVAFVNNFRVPDPKRPNRTLADRNLVIDWIELIAPAGATKLSAADLPAAHKAIILRQPTAATRQADARTFIAAFARRAFRRPVTDAEVSRLARYVDMAQKEGESFERGMQLAVQATLVSPNFLFRVEIDPKPNDPKAKRLLGDYEIANRLSYFLWSSMPDEALFAAAAKGQLQTPAGLKAQLARMLKDPKASALADNFASQWLQLRSLGDARPDPKKFPAWNNELREAMRTETLLFFQNVVREDRPILDFLDARYTFLNETLAKHYGNTSVTGDQFRRVALQSGARGGLITQASVLTVTSNPTRTSPVKRGKWILEQILGTPPPPPPPGAGELPEDKKGVVVATTVRKRLEQHRSDPACASCHARMDPLGFGLENFDPTGAWRTTDAGNPIDVTGTLPDGKTFAGPAQLKTILLGKKDQFARSFTERLLTYALGRGVESTDRCNVDEIAQNVAQNNYRFSAVVTEIVLSDPFRKRRGDNTIAPPAPKQQQASR